MSQDTALYAFVIINALTSFGTLASIFFLIKNQKSNFTPPQAPQDNLEENLTTRLRDLQMRQFSLRVPNYKIPSYLNKDVVDKDKK